MDSEGFEGVVFWFCRVGSKELILDLGVVQFVDDLFVFYSIGKYEVLEICFGGLVDKGHFVIDEGDQYDDVRVEIRKLYDGVGLVGLFGCF